MIEFLTVDDIAEMLKASPEFVYKHRKFFGGIKVGRLVRFPKRVFENMIEEVINDECIQTGEAMVLRLQSQREETKTREIQVTKRSDRSRSKSKAVSGEDKYQLYEALRIATEGTGIKENK